MTGTTRITTTAASPSTQFYLSANERPVTEAMIAENYTVVRCYIRSVNRGNSTSNYGGSGVQVGELDGTPFRTHSGNPFLPGGYSTGEQRWEDGPYDVRVDHDADGSKTVTLKMVLDYGNVDWERSAELTLTTLPRASTPTLSPATLDAGETMSIATNGVVGFTHTVTYKIGTKTGTIETGVGASTSWVPDESLLSEVPGLSRGGTVTVETFSSGTSIGTKDVPFTLRVPESVKPSVTLAVPTEAVPLVASAVGAFVQSLSKLNVAITSESEAYGSEIVSRTISVAGQTIAGASGVTDLIQATGPVDVVASITDARGRTGTATRTITVLPYSLPQVDTTVLQVRRANVSGTPVEDGEKIRVDLKAAVAPLIVGTQKNALTYRVLVRPRSSSTWVQKATLTGGITFDDDFLISDTYPVTQSFDVLVVVEDKFRSTEQIRLIATDQVLMALGPDGVGFGKFPAPGRVVDAADVMYQNNGEAVASINDVEDLIAEIPVPEGLPVGTHLAGEWGAAPAGFVLSDGAVLNISAYPALAAHYAATYGASNHHGGNGTTTFAVPDTRERVYVNQGGTDIFAILGATAGAKTHAHDLSDAAHAQIRLTNATGGAIVARRISVPSWEPGFTVSATGATAGGTSSVGTPLAGETDASSTVQPSFVCRYIIRAA